jgi:hypothetical protein
MQMAMSDNPSAAAELAPAAVPDAGSGAAMAMASTAGQLLIRMHRYPHDVQLCPS